MFRDAAAFNANISKWETGQVTRMDLSTSTSLFTLFAHWMVSLICFFDLFFNSPLLFVVVLAIHLFVSIVIDVGGG